MSTVKISQLPNLTRLDSNTSNTILVGIDSSTSVTSQFTARILAESLFSNTALNVGNNAIILPNVIAQFVGNSSNYLQTNLQNKVADGSADYVITADTGTDDKNYIDLGLAGSTNTDATYTSILPLDGYLYVQGNTATGTGGNLIIGTTTAGRTVNIIAGGPGSDKVQVKISTDGVNLVAKPLKFADGSSQNTSTESTGPFANSAFVRANSSFGVANSAGLYANGAFGSANSASLYANGAFVSSNSASLYANGAFGASNSASSYANSGFGVANSGSLYANAAFIQANAVFNRSNNQVWPQANAAFNSSNTVGVYANAAFDIANSAALYANGAFTAANTATSASLYANGAFSAANSASIFASGAFINSNNAYTTANSGGLYANGAFGAANSSSQYANAAFTKANTAYTLAGTQAGRLDVIEPIAQAAYTTSAGALANTSGTTFDGDLNVSGKFNAIKGYIFTQRLPVGNQTTITIDYSVDTMIKANLVADLTVSHINFTTGKVVELWLVNSGGTQRTVTHGVSALNSTINSTTFAIPSTSSAHIRYFVANGDLANTFVKVSHA